MAKQTPASEPNTPPAASEPPANTSAPATPPADGDNGNDTGGDNGNGTNTPTKPQQTNAPDPAGRRAQEQNSKGKAKPADAGADNDGDENGDKEDLATLREKAAAYDSIQAEFEPLQRENRSAAKELRDLKAKVQTYEREKMTEKERLEAQLQDREGEVNTVRTQLRTARLENGVDREAEKRNIAPDLLMDLIGDKVEFDDEGRPTNITSLAEALVKKHPNLQIRELPSGGGNSHYRRDGKATLTVEDIANMSDEEMESRWDEVQKVLSKAN